MKISALLARGKGRDFYDTMFLLQQTEPNMAYLKATIGINSKKQLKRILLEKVAKNNLNIKKTGFRTPSVQHPLQRKNFTFRRVYRKIVGDYLMKPATYEKITVKALVATLMEGSIKAFANRE